MAVVCLNGRFVAQKQALISVTDHGFLYGDGVYETIRVHSGRPLFFAEHLQRLRRSARGIHLSTAQFFRRLPGWTRALIKKNALKNAALRITLTRGPGPYGFDPRLCTQPTLVITALPFDGYPVSYYKNGIRVAIVAVERNGARALPPRIKSTSCLNGILAKIESLRAGAQEGVMLTQDGFVAEGTVSNIFALKRGALYTPTLDGGLLPGVTRGKVLQAARRAGYRTIERKLKPADLFAAEEIFLTSSLMDVVPVARLLWRGKVRFSRARFPCTWHLAAVYKASYR